MTITSHPVYQLWAGVKARCLNPKHAAYSRYGGRGIKICDRWRHDFEAFASDMGTRPSPLHSIDRIDNNGNYEPGNCRWATRLDQSKNTSRNHWILINGERKTLGQWLETMGMPVSTYWNRIRRGMSPAEALTSPLTPRMRTLTVGGETLRLCEWARKTGILPLTIQARIARGWSPEQVIERATSPRKLLSRKAVSK